jgi:hypothetical protein
MPLYTLDYLIEKFEQALFDLATGEGEARSRLEVAYHRFWVIQLGDYPPALREKRQAIEQWLTRLKARDGDLVQYNLRHMHNRTASRICGLIVDLHWQLLRERQKTQIDPP